MTETGSRRDVTMPVLGLVVTSIKEFSSHFDGTNAPAMGTLSLVDYDRSRD